MVQWNEAKDDQWVYGHNKEESNNSKAMYKEKWGEILTSCNEQLIVVNTTPKHQKNQSVEATRNDDDDEDEDDKEVNANSQECQTLHISKQIQQRKSSQKQQLL